MRIIAILIRSAAVPCNGVFTAVRSANPRRFGVPALDVWNGPHASEQCPHPPLAPRLIQHAIDVRAHALVSREIGSM